MKWIYSIQHKMTAALLLTVILVLTLVTNLVDQRRFKELDESFSSLYEDRLMAESYIFHLYENLKKEQDLLKAVSEGHGNSSTRKALNDYTSDRDQLMAKFAQTYLTPEEETAFQHLKTNLDRIDNLEAVIANTTPEGISHLVHMYSQITDEAFATLSILADIQTAEGAILQNKSHRMILGGVSFSHFEMALLIVMAIIIQVLILSSKSMLTTASKNPSLN